MGSEDRDMDAENTLGAVLRDVRVVSIALNVPGPVAAGRLAAERAVTAALAVLRARDQSGAGVQTEVAISESARALALPLRHGLTAPGGILRGGDIFYGIYPAAEGYVALAALEPHFRERLVRLLGISADPAVLPEFGPELMARLGERTAVEWEAWGREHDVPIAAVREATGPAS